ncbi:putative sN-glycerol-3-phosphate transport integral membrane protein ABC transporter UgpA [Mycobacterium kansasii]|uniref:Putative sN-glycerol-3-phosphate transport integral membrane protein ABC transporter UgpA n=1 Tax=Mycobacterium kansasii TaxID=1768 RepID=A0A1V3XUY6_MYCKA|nr:putative sN-glycerol-3-phosphate transport integral membrane protein ABC transporter UgpA [Mycobacterium kansasii]
MGLLLLFIYRPLADNIRLSFFDWNVSDPKADYVGFSNYAEWFARDDTRQIVLNTAVFTTAAVVGSMVLGLVLAMLLDQPLRARNLVRSMVFAPFVISGRPSAWRPSSSSIRTSVWYRTCWRASESTCPTFTRMRTGRCSW